MYPFVHSLIIFLKPYYLPCSPNSKIIRYEEDGAMQKHFQTKLFSLILGITFLLIPEFANAGIISLPRYTGEFAYRSNSGGRDKTCSSSYKYTCSGTGYAGGSGTSCNDLYPSCSCSTNYKWSGGSCVLKSCSDYGYSASKDNTKSCEEKTPRSGLTCYVCTACDGSTYKYACSGGLNASTQGTSNKCGTNYSKCECVEHASWNSSSGKCECGSDYKAGTTSCTLKTCEDYGYSATEDTTKNCTKQTPRSGLACWNCSDCTGTLYDCGSITNASGGAGTSCGGKYPQCTCKDLYRWDNGTCKLNCTRNSCSTTAYPLTAQNAANASSYEKCTPSCSDELPRYKVSACASGYSVNSNGSGCDAVPTKTCAEWLTEKGYALVTTRAELQTAMDGTKEIVVMNDISDIDGYDVVTKKSIYTPAYFQAQNSNCSGITTLKFYDQSRFKTSADQTLNIYVNFDCNDIDHNGIGAGSKVNFYGNLYISSSSGLVLDDADVAVYGKKAYVGDGYVRAKTFTVSENTSFYMGYEEWLDTKLILKKGAVAGQITYDGYHYKIKALSDITFEKGRNSYSNLPYNCTERGNTNNYRMWKCIGSIEGHCYNNYDMSSDTYSDEVNLALCHYCGDASVPSYPSYCNNHQRCTWITTLNSTGHCVGTTGSYIRCAPEGTSVEGYKNIGSETLGGEDECGNSAASLNFTPVQKCYNACTDDRGFDYDVIQAWLKMKGIGSFDSEDGYISYCRDVLSAGEGSWGEGNYEFYYNGTKYTTSENAMSTCKCLRVCNDKDYKYPSNY